MEKEFIRVRSVKDILAFVTLIVGGSVLIMLPTAAGVNLAGFFLILTGLILAFILKSDYQDPQTGERYAKTELYFKQAMHAAVYSAIASKPEAVDLAEAEKGNALKLDVYYNKASGKAYLQLFEYVPHTYEPCSQVYEYDLERIQKLIR
ncbi:MAG: hypothetical protein IKW27_09170 [Bacteroidales bacterium]|nr:hypothetical protein [Bacteroidales bacterium]